MRRAILLILGLLAAAAAICVVLMGGDEVRGREPDEAKDSSAAQTHNSAAAKAQNLDSTREREQNHNSTESAPALAQQSEEDVQKSPLVFRGVVLDPDRKPVRGAEVSAVRTGGPGGNDVNKTQSGDDGKFKLGLRDRTGWGWRLEVRAPGFAVSYLDNVPAWHPEIDVGPIVVFPYTTAQGRVVDRDGRPVGGAKLFVYIVSQPSEDEDEWVSGDYKPVTTSAPDGKYSIPSLPPGKVTIGAEAPGYADAVRPGITLSRDKPNDLDITMAAEEEIKGFVVDEVGGSVAKARVVARNDSARNAFWRKPTESDSQGKFTLHGLDRARRNLNIQINKLGYSSLWQDGSHLPADEKYVLRKAAIVDVKVEGAEGAAAGAIRTVRFERKNTKRNNWYGYGEINKSQREIITPQNWRVSTEQRGPSRVYVATDDGAAGTTNEFEIPQGNLIAPMEVTVRLRPPGLVTGRVTGTDLNPIANVRLELSSNDRNASFVRIATSDANGTFAFDKIPPGNAMLRSRSADWVCGETKVEVRAGEKTENLEITARKPSKISGKLTIGEQAPGEPVPIAFYKIESRDNYTWWAHLGFATTDNAGMYQFSPAPSGRIALVPKRKTDNENGSVRSFENESRHPEWNDEERNRWQWIADVPPEAEAVYDVRLPELRPSIVRGQVLVNNEPRAGMDLWLYGERGGDWRSETTNSDGKFRFRLDNPGTYQIQLWGDGFSENRSVTVGEGDEREVNITFSAGAIEGSICDMSGRALGLRVRLERQRERNSNNNGWFYETPEQTTKPDGSYAFAEAVAGSYRVIVDDYQRKFATVGSPQFTIGPKERYAVPQIRVPLASPVVVTVKNAEGQPITGRVTVTAAPNTEPLIRKTASATINRQGVGRVLGVRPGAVVVKIQPNGHYQPAEETVTLPSDGSETPVTFELKKKDGPEPPANNNQNQQFPEGEMMNFPGNYSFEDFDGEMIIHSVPLGGDR